MTTEELITWLQDELAYASCDKRKAEDARDGNGLWYFNGKMDIIRDILEKINP